MKTEKNKKKLVLNKITITQLGKDIINRIKGGTEESFNINCPNTPVTLNLPQCPTTTNYNCHSQDNCQGA